MKKLWVPMILGLSLLGSACTKRSAPSDDLDMASTESTQTNDDFQLQDNNMAETESEATDPVIVDEPLAPAAATNVEPEINSSEETRQYVTSKGDTLMLIAFKIYGDYTRWHEIKEMNKELLGKAKGPLKSGLTLSYKAPSQEFVQEANGEPYLIKAKDTLGKISKKVYKTPKKWKEIWKNNSYIKNPNIIFAGFTLFYQKITKNLANR